MTMSMPSTINPPKKTMQKPLIKPPTNPLLSLLFMLLPSTEKADPRGFNLAGTETQIDPRP